MRSDTMKKNCVDHEAIALRTDSSVAMASLPGGMRLNKNPSEGGPRGVLGLIPASYCWDADLPEYRS